MPHTNFVRTKIVATLGPATSTRERLGEMLEAGVNVCRINFSHGAPEEHAGLLRIIRELADERQVAIAVLGDLCGPKIRLNKVRPGVGLSVGQSVRIVRGDADGDDRTLTVNYARFVDEIRVGNRVYIDDGLVRLLVSDRDDDSATCICTAGGPISSRKGVNLPDTRLSVSALSEKDRADVAWAIRNDLDFVALSFVRRPEDVRELKNVIAAANSTIPVIAKIEKAEAIEELDAVIAESDGVMIARGDLGVEMDIWQVPLMQKEITTRCREAIKPVIVATQMLQSMVSNLIPTRAEASDVANAILDGVDAVMLSAESATGEHPVAAVEVMRRIARATDEYQARRIPGEPATVPAATARATSAITLGAVRAARHIGARLIAAWTATGMTVRLIARFRLDVPVLGLTHDERVWRQMALLHGVIPLRVPLQSNPMDMMRTLDALLLTRRLAENGDLVVVVTSTRPNMPGATDTTLVHRVGG